LNNPIAVKNPLNQSLNPNTDNQSKKLRASINRIHSIKNYLIQGNSNLKGRGQRNKPLIFIGQLIDS
jgi:hypothetical protein